MKVLIILAYILLKRPFAARVITPNLALKHPLLMTITFVIVFIEGGDSVINPLKIGILGDRESGESTEDQFVIKLAHLKHTVIDGKADQLGAALKFHLGHDIVAVSFHSAFGNT